MKGIIVYNGKYGATLQYAIWLGAELNLQVLKTDTADAPKIAPADYVIIGTSVYIGKLQVASWLKRNKEILKNKKLIFFMVAGTPPEETAKLNAFFTQGVPEVLRRNVACHFLPGSLQFSRLSLMDKILLRMGARLAAARGEKIHQTDYNNVSKDKLTPLLEEARSLTAASVLAR